MSVDRPILEYFPKHLRPRPIQAKILSDIEQAVKSGYKKIVLCAPTGSGKSPVAMALAERFNSSFVITASKALQDQYSGDFVNLKPVKGKSNFACLKQMKRDGIPSTDLITATTMGLTCEKGECSQRIEDGKTIDCEFKPPLAKFETGDLCPYYTQKYEALMSPHSLWNYSSYFQTIKFNRETYGQYLNRQVSIFDEAHKLEDQIIQFIGIDITESQLRDCNINTRLDSSLDIDDVIDLLESMSEFYARAIKEIEEVQAQSNNPDYSGIMALDKRYKSVSQSRVDIIKDRDNFVINDSDAYGGMISVLPIDISKYVELFLITPYQIFMSATIDKDSFCETAGLQSDIVAFIDVDSSPFKPENRAVEFLNVGALNYNTPPEIEARLVNTINNILTVSHPDDRGIILTSSMRWCNVIINGMSERNKSRVRLCHARNPDGKTQGEVLKEHAKTPGSVLLSSSLWEGVDLKDDLSRFQIIAKVPYPSLGDTRTKVKKDRYPLWYHSQTITRMLQGMGRSIRSESDWARTYVLDSAAESLVSRRRQMIPKSYHDVLRV